MCVTLWYQRLPKHWPWLTLLTAAAFAAALFFNPPYPFAPEDNLTYRDMIVLHQQAAAVIESKYPYATVLTAWPATTELEHPQLGYVHHPLKIIAIDNFDAEQIARAATNPGAYDTALIFSTKWVPNGGLNLARASESNDNPLLRFPSRSESRRGRAPPPRRRPLAARNTRRVGRRPPLPPLERSPPRPTPLNRTYNEVVLKPLKIAALALLPVLPVLAQDANQKEPNGRVVLVLPFDNRSGQPNLNWIGDSFPDTLNARLSSSGFLPITRDDRQFALDHLGLPPDFRPTRATTLRIAQTLDADYVIVGSYNLTGAGPAQKIQVQAQVLDVNKLFLSAPLQDSSDLPRLFDAENAIAWKVARQIDPRFQVAEQTFLAASAGVQLSAFENYIRGTDATTPTERTKRLQTAIAVSPGYAAAQLALGKELYADREYDQAAAVLSKVQPTNRLALEANFFLGLSRFNTAKYAEAEQAFAFVAARLPLPEVVNDQAVAASRQGKDATPLFQRASSTDPNDPDYHYNLAVAHFLAKDLPAAQRELDQTLKLRPNDTEAQQLRALTAGTGNPNGFDPTTRLRRTYSEASFRQAAYQMDQLRALRVAMLAPDKQAAEYAQAGRDYLAQGLLPEAEQEFMAAIAADSGAPAGHAGLARVREQSGDANQARMEANASLRLRPNVEAYLVLARLDLQANNLPASAQSVQAALRLEPANPAASGMRQALRSRGQNLP